LGGSEIIGDLLYVTMIAGVAIWVVNVVTGVFFL
jgi:hypothetical protein